MLFEFEIEDKKHSLYFGMVATQIMEERGIKGLVGFDHQKEETKLKTFAYLIFGGLCNQADRKDKARPGFEDAYDLMVEILEQGVELQNRLWETWQSTKPAKAMLAALPKPPAGKKKSATKTIGTK